MLALLSLTVSCTILALAGSWEVKATPCPQQTDGTSCGLLAALNAALICRRAKLNYKVDHPSITQLRAHVLSELIAGRLKPLDNSLLLAGLPRERKSIFISQL